jgi:uncharacterized membrane protein SpoIIM required for sporulation
MDLDAFVATRGARWSRLESLLRRRGALSGAEVDELVDLYQSTATDLSVVRSAAPDPALVSRLSSLVARSRSAVTGARSSTWRDAARFVTVTFPVAVYRMRWWWTGAAIGFMLVAVALGWWVASDPAVQASVGAPEEIRQLVDTDFEAYYSSEPAGAFAAKVWTNNVWVAALCLVFGGLLGLPVIYILWQNAANVGIAGGLMVAYGKGPLFFGLILPHGLLELTAVFVAAGAGLRLGWTVVDPGGRRRSEALAAEGRTTITIAIGAIGVLLVSGVIEAFVTPSPLPTWARLTIGVLALVAFLAYVFVLGRRGVAAGETGDLRGADAPDLQPAVG